MLFIKLISFYFLFLSFPIFGVSDSQTDQQPTYKQVLHFRLPYSTLPEVLQTTMNRNQRVPLPRSVQSTLRTFDPTPHHHVRKKTSEIIFFKVTNCPGSDFSFVVKGIPKGENNALNRIARHLQDIRYSPPPSLPTFVRAEFTLELANGKNLTVYHAAKGKRLHDILTQPSSDDEITQYEDDMPLFRHLGRALFNAHERFRPTHEELALVVTDGQINIHRFYLDIDATEPEPDYVKLVPYSAEKMRYFFSRCVGDVQPTNIFLHDNEVALIDYLTMTRDLPDENGFSSIANDVSYFIACTRVCFRLFYHRRSTTYLNTVMGAFLAGYLEKVPAEYRPDVCGLIRDSFKWFVDKTMMPSLNRSPVNNEERSYEAAREKYKNKDIKIILDIAAQSLSANTTSTAAAAAA